MIKVKNISKIYKDKSSEQEIFSDLSIDFKASTSYSIVGPSGSGKTTFLNLISGLDAFDNGSITIKGTELSTADPEAKSKLRKGLFGFAYQFHYLLDNLTVFENCLASCFGKNNRSIQKILKDLEIAHIKDKFPSNISGGERQMLAIGCALINSPKLIILDEPTTGLSPQLSKEVADSIKTILNDGTSVAWVVEENPKDVLEIAEWVNVMDGGEIRLSDDAKTILNSKDFKKLFLGI